MRVTWLKEGRVAELTRDINVPFEAKADVQEESGGRDDQTVAARVVSGHIVSRPTGIRRKKTEGQKIKSMYSNERSCTRRSREENGQGKERRGELKRMVLGERGSKGRGIWRRRAEGQNQAPISTRGDQEGDGLANG
jgi:hypothetical protein